MTDIPTCDEFLALPDAEAAKVAPATMIYSNGGSRRRAALAGIDLASEEYPRWSQQQMCGLVETLLRHGVRHLFFPMLMPNQYNEVSPNYRERIEEWAAWGLAGPDMRQLYADRGWRARMIGAVDSPTLAKAVADLGEQPADGRPTIWWMFARSSEQPWEWILAAARRSQAASRAELARELYGEDIPPATLFLSFGKPLVNHDLLPPLLVGDLQCYWTQQPGYVLSDRDMRLMLYDYAYLRPTWMADKTGRAELAAEHRAAWDHGPLLGLGQKLGPFWYPQPWAMPGADD
ncbi:MAG TPA: hypothetical protein VGE07_08100 [Herpetosiphonaceae bacterium]